MLLTGDRGPAEDLLQTALERTARHWDRLDGAPEAYARRIRTTRGALLVKASDLAHNSDPLRLAVLDELTRTRLTRKYATMRALLGLPPG